MTECGAAAINVLNGGNMEAALPLDQETLARLDNMAERAAVSRLEIVKRALAAYEYELALNASVERGRRDIKEGRFLAAEEIDAYAEERIAKFLQQSAL